ncbi:MAG: thioredoxin domain-containing protein, partial [Proteobacteria bacterium]|nr:thioredoxin domain-containing protein [Pseudomonadota bacterium]
MPNELANETSPYLLQHADNPVHWLPWNEASLALARDGDKPILLSIGYSACHWCHVMAHESFEDEPTAQLMNALYINIKVDREERPDIDKIYQTAHQLATRSAGGWPLTVFLTPEQLPILTGTYFSRPVFQQVLTRVESFYRGNREQAHARGDALRSALASIDVAGDPSAELGPAPLGAARERLGQTFDAEHGGFGGAPKFPHPNHVATLLRAWRRTVALTDRQHDGDGRKRDDEALHMATVTLGRMARGGLYDHLAGGFFRYSVDQRWEIPHFEKMLYDNAELMAVLADTYAATGDAFFAGIAEETAEWVMDEMQDPEGGYYATLDADSEGEEGKFYLWTRDQAQSVLAENEYAVFGGLLGLTEPPNFEGREWHLQVRNPDGELSPDILDGESPLDLLDSARRKLLSVRDRRVRPGRDEKVLTGWNGLMIRAMARAARVLGRDDLADSAASAVDFVRAHLWLDGRLLACYKDGRARFPAYLDDYAFLADGLLELLQVRWRSRDLALACELADVMLARFADPRGGFFFTADDHEALIHRPKPLADEATPSGNGIAVRVLVCLGSLLGETRYLEAARRALAAAWPMLERFPEAHGALLHSLELSLDEPEAIIIRGQAMHDIQEWKDRADAGFHPQRLSFGIPAQETDLPGALAERKPRGDVVAYVCHG